MIQKFIRKHLPTQKLIVLLCVVLLLSTLGTSGCASRDANQEPDRRLPGSLQNLSFEEHLDISVGYWNIEDMAKAIQPDGMTQYIEELFNITLHPVSVTWSNYKERYQILSATHSLPDIFATLTLSSTDNNDSATFTNMIETGSIRALPEDISSFPVLCQVLESTPFTRYTDGKYYAIPRISFLDPLLGATDAAMLVRRDWMNALGFDDPESLEEFAEMTAAFANSDPDGNGLDDTLGYNVNSLAALGKWVILGIAPECNVYSWVEENGRFVPSWTTDAFRDVVLAYSMLYDTGSLDPQFYSKSPINVLEDFASGRLGALEYKSSPPSLAELKDKWDALNDLPFEECVDVLPIFPAPDGVRYSNSSNIFWSESYLSSSVDDKKAERILALLEFLLSEEGQRLCHFGLEGTDYTFEDGQYQCLLDVEDENLTMVLAGKYPSISLFSGIATWGGGWSDFEVNTMNDLRYGNYNTFLAQKSAIWCRDNTTQVTRPYDFLLSPKEATDQFSTSRAMDAFIQCIIGGGDALARWDHALENMRARGLEEYIDRQNQIFRQ